MIDTIEFRVHGITDKVSNTLEYIQRKNSNVSLYYIQEHHDLYKKMLMYKNRLFYMVKTVRKQTQTTEPMDESEFLHFQTQNKHNKFEHIQDVMRIVDQDVVKETNMRINGKYSSPSSLSAVTFKINENGGYIDFNLSIPKYLYSHSLAEFIPQAGSSLFFNSVDMQSYNVQRKYLFERIHKFLDRFIMDLCKMFKLDCLLNKEYIELRRIDLCYNQYFESKEDALLILEEQKKIAKIKSTNANNKRETFKTSLTYFTSSGAYFKIYHKGSEYVSSKFGDLKKHTDFNKEYLEKYIRNNSPIENKIENDLKRLDLVHDLFDNKIKGKPISYNKDLQTEINKTAKLVKKHQPFKVEFLKNEMDKVLRYEISLRGDFFAHNYKTKVFRKNCETYQDLKKVHSLVHSYFNSQKDLKVNRQQLKDYKSYNKFIKRKVSLTFSRNKKQNDFIVKDKFHAYNKKTLEYRLEMLPYEHTLLRDKDVGVFNDDFLQVCINYFIKTVKSFQVEKLSNFDDVLSKVKTYNDGVNKRVDVYNSLNHYTTKDIHGKFIFKGNKRITKATQLLSETQKRNLGLKKVQSIRVAQILREMERGLSLANIRDVLGIEKSTFSRLKADLEIFGIFESTLSLEKDIHSEISFRQYYHNTQGLEYQQNFYFKPIHFKHG